MTDRISKSECGAIAAFYRDGMTLRRIGTTLGRSAVSCQNVLIRLNIPRRQPTQTLRRYAVNESFFDHIDTQSKAYWLGFLTADGNVCGNMLRVGLQASDIGHIQKFKVALQSEQPVRFCSGTIRGSKYQAVHINIGSQRLVNALAILGMRPHKSFTIKPCTQVPEHLLNHYWRGIWDGDGCIYESLSSPHRGGFWSVSLVGNQSIVDGFASYIKRFINSKAIVAPLSSIYQIHFGGILLPQTILRILYHDAAPECWLDRKRKLSELCWQYLPRQKCHIPNLLR